MVDSTDHLTGKTGLTPTVTLSKSGSAFAAPAGAVTEIANGWYKVAANATDTNTLGPLILHATGTAADPVDVEYAVVAYDVQDAVRLGLSAVPNAAAGANGGFPILSSGGTTLAYTVTTVSTVNGLAADSVNASALAASAVAEIQTGLFLSASYAAPDNAGIAAIKAKTDNLPASPAAVGSAMTLANGAIVAATFAADAISAAALSAGAVAEIQNGLFLATSGATLAGELATAYAEIAKIPRVGFPTTFTNVGSTTNSDDVVITATT